jgi:two-component system sensor histidine kinase PilS (NtrC family)
MGMLAQVKTANWPELAAILLIRLGFLWLLVLLSLLIPHDDTAFHAFMGVAFIITIPYSLWLRDKLRASEFAPLQFIVDLLLVTGLVYFTGGIHSDLALLYPLVILSAGIIGTPKQAAEITLLAIITYVLMATLLKNDLIVEYAPAGASLATGEMGTTLLMRSLVFAVFGAASIYVAKRCHLVQSRGEATADATATLLSAIPVPALLLNSDGGIVFANEASCKLLDRKPEALLALRFSDLMTAGIVPIDEIHGPSANLERPGRKPLPVAYRSSDFRLPETALTGSKGENTEVNLSLLILEDLTRKLETEKQLGRIDRVASATRIAGELAHEIRTPLTTLSASVQLLRRYEETATAADWLPNSPRRRDRIELFNHIEDASSRMDSVVRNFVDFAEFSPADLISIIKLDSIEQNEGYISHLTTIGRDSRDGENTHSGRRSDDT